MPTFYFHKLVRDKIVDQQLAAGAKPAYRKLSSRDHKSALIDKLIEEASEIQRAPAHELAGEIADLQQVIDDLRSVCGLSAEEVRKAQLIKNERAGSFAQGYFVEAVEVDLHSHWVAYYRDNADRYPEITR